MLKYVGGLFLVWATAGCASSYSAAPAPIIDHHQHLLSPAASEHLTRPTPPEIAVPGAIGQVIAQRAEHWNNAAALRAIYTDDAIMLGAEAPGWIRGNDEAAAFISGRFARAYHLTPIAFHDFGNVAELAGYYSRGAQAERQLIGFFSMTLMRGEDGQWRIASETPVFPGPSVEPILDGAGLVSLLDAAHIDRAVILSGAYYFDAPRNRRQDYYAQVRAENDWTAAQASHFPNRLIAFCSFNPLEAYAIAELQRCAQSGAFRGLKLHFDTSEVELTNPEHVAKVRAVYAEANRLGLAVIAHISNGPDYGRTQAETFVNQILPAAPDTLVVIAHLWGGGGYSAEALAVFADAVRAGRANNLYFEVAQVTLAAGDSQENLQQIADRMREIGLDRIFYGSDGPQFGGRPPAEMWNEFRVRMPLTAEEIAQIARNTAVYAR